MTKINRNYRVTINTASGETIIVEPPFTFQFSVARGAGATLNTIDCMIYNLSPETRSKIFQDRFNLSAINRILVEAGYGNELSVIFKGTIMFAHSMRQASNIVTIISAKDGGTDVVNTQSNFTLAAGATQKNLIERLVGDYPSLNSGTIGGTDSLYQRPVVIEGNTWEKIQIYSNFKAFIDLEEVNILDDNQVKTGFLPVIDDSTGLLETPRREGAGLIIRTLFEPRIIIAQLVEVISTILPIYNGQYKVIGLRHNGIISEAQNSQCTSEFNLLLGGSIFKFQPVEK